jgi:hypothetical protein
VHAGVNDVLETGQAARLTMEIARLREPAHLQHGLTPRFALRHALPHVLLGQQRDMRRQLIVEVLVEPLPAEDCHDTGQRFQKAPDHRPRAPEVASTRPMTDERRSHVAASTASAFSPARVSE